MNSKLTQSQEQLKESLKHIAINTFDGRESLYNLCYVIGVKYKEKFYCDVQKLKPKGKRTMNNQFITKREFHDFILYFNNGFSVRVERKVYNLFKETKEVETRKRIN